MQSRAVSQGWLPDDNVTLYVKKFGKAVGLHHGLFLRGEALDVQSGAGPGRVGDRGRRQWDASGLFGGTRTAGSHRATSPWGKTLFPP